MNLVGTDIMYMNLVGTGPSFDPSKIKELVFLRFLLQNLDGIRGRPKTTLTRGGG